MGNVLGSPYASPPREPVPLPWQRLLQLWLSPPSSERTSSAASFQPQTAEQDKNRRLCMKKLLARRLPENWVFLCGFRGAPQGFHFSKSFKVPKFKNAKVSELQSSKASNLKFQTSKNIFRDIIFGSWNTHVQHCQVLRF